jgi:hypothetical protein
VNIIPYDPHLWLRLLAGRWQAQALAQRTKIQGWIDAANDTAEQFINQHCPNEKRKLIEAKAAFRAYTRGVPLTEVLDDDELLAEDTPDLSDAEQFLLKKAYRMAHMALHPDRKGGEESDETRRALASLRAAYKAKDLRAVQEFVLHLDKSVVEQATYWREERGRADITWEIFKTTPAFAVARDVQRGRPTQHIRESLVRYLTQLRLRYEAQLINMQAHAVSRGSEPEQFDKP